uniref:Uncharacterized protein n=1 Tax=Tanacetum cinerariifolium TaxID=118510 RepID=A0A6L2K707_TANCI|nr:hypothetical protein [Tanacetum cinerariifolium]
MLDLVQQNRTPRFHMRTPDDVIRIKGDGVNDASALKKGDIHIVDADNTDTTRGASMAKDVAGYVKDATMGSVSDKSKMAKDVADYHILKPITKSISVGYVADATCRVFITVNKRSYDDAKIEIVANEKDSRDKKNWLISTHLWNTDENLEVLLSQKRRHLLLARRSEDGEGNFSSQFTGNVLRSS